MNLDRPALLDRYRLLKVYRRSLTLEVPIEIMEGAAAVAEQPVSDSCLPATVLPSLVPGERKMPPRQPHVPRERSPRSPCVTRMLLPCR